MTPSERFTDRPSDRDSISREDERLLEALRRTSDPLPPPDLTRRVMARIAALPRPTAGDAHFTQVAHASDTAEAGFWRRLARWAFSPRPIRVSPAGAVLALAAVVVLVTTLWLQRPTPTPSGADTAVAVRFVLPDPDGQARSVAVVGSFNQWDAKGYGMHYDPAAKAWILTLRLRPGTHEYAFLVNGDRVEPDPAARFSRDDGFGSRNSLLLLEGDGHAI